MELRLHRVKYVPKELSSGVLYVSEEYGVAAHLCACGCGSKVAVPLGPAEWKFSEKGGLPTLRPSIGSGQLPCNSHYLIIDGRIVWARAMSAEQTSAALQSDQRRRHEHYASQKPPEGFLSRLWKLAMRFLRIR